MHEMGLWQPTQGNNSIDKMTFFDIYPTSILFNWENSKV